MAGDERAIRDLVDAWMEAGKTGDTATMLELFTDDVIFMASGKEPFGKEAWSDEMKGVRIDGSSDFLEVRVCGDWAWMRSRINMAMTPSDGGKPERIQGYALTILQKGSDGRWRISRDANLPLTRQ
jgi:uncharacterized protein (TIGR02246 family)